MASGLVTLARWYASAAWAAQDTPTVTFEPWFPVRGLITAGPPAAATASAASAAELTTTPCGTGIPASASSCLASTLSAAMSTPTADVRSVSAAHTRRRWTP